MNVKNEIITIRACGYPYLVERLVISILSNIKSYGMQRDCVIINIINDTKTKDSVKVFETLVSRLNSVTLSNVVIDLYHIHDKNRLLKKLDDYRGNTIPKEELRMIISQEFQNLGGTVGAYNYALLVSQYTIGKYNLNEIETIATFHDDDVHYSVLEKSKDGYKVSNFDFFRERQTLFLDSRCKAISGRYTHHTGSPYKMLLNFFSVLEIMVKLSVNKKNDRTVLHTFENEENQIITSGNIKNNVTKVLNSFIQRTPVAGLYTVEGNAREADQENFTINGGILSIRATELENLLIIPFSLQDLVLTAQIRNELGQGSLFVCTGLRHIRNPKETGLAASPHLLIDAVLREDDAKLYMCLKKLLVDKKEILGKKMKDISVNRYNELRKAFSQLKKNSHNLENLKVTSPYLAQTYKEVLSCEKTLLNLVSYSNSDAALYRRSEYLWNLYINVYPYRKEIHKLFKDLGSHDLVSKKFKAAHLALGAEVPVLFSFDLDGTLRSGETGPLRKGSDTLTSLIKKINENNITVLNTNNSIESALSANEILRFDYVICENGSLIFDCKSKELVVVAKTSYLTEQREIINKLKRANIKFFHQRKATIYIRDGEKFLLLLNSLNINLENLGVQCFFSRNGNYKIQLGPPNVNKFTSINYILDYNQAIENAFHFGDDVLDVLPEDCVSKKIKTIGIKNHRLEEGSNSRFDHILAHEDIHGIINFLKILDSSRMFL
ncbi:MAG: haloacid dehalogenase-like hydrolase [Candidatus Parcubacteria bacterium]|jgi:hydroxymethylpyrimidine pyrophosphatase-like HAD family hydrolase